MRDTASNFSGLRNYSTGVRQETRGQNGSSRLESSLQQSLAHWTYDEAGTNSIAIKNTRNIVKLPRWQDSISSSWNHHHLTLQNQGRRPTRNNSLADVIQHVRSEYTKIAAREKHHLSRWCITNSPLTMPSTDSGVSWRNLQIGRFREVKDKDKSREVPDHKNVMMKNIKKGLD